MNGQTGGKGEGISAPFIRYPIGTSLLMAGILFVGLVAYPLLPVAPHARGWAVHPWADVLLPEPAETFSRSWSSQSQPPIVAPQPQLGEVSPTIVDPYTFQQPMIVAPTGRRR